MQQKFHNLLVLDFEASCDNNSEFMNEIIEFPTVVVNTTKLIQEIEFHQYVQPTVNKQLTEFCKELTGIQQEWIDNGQPSLQACLETYHQWMIDNKFILRKESSSDPYAYELNPENTFQFVTCGDWDLKTMLRTQAKREGLAVPAYFNQFINVKNWYENHFNQKAWGMSNMLQMMNMTLEGKHHSGIDDCRNISKICVGLIQQGVVLDTTYDAKKGSLIDFSSSKWVPIDNDGIVQIKLTMRPSKSDLAQLASENCTHVVSVLHPTKEGAKKIGRMVEDAKMIWTLVPQVKEPVLFSAEQSTQEFKDQKAALAKVIEMVKDAESTKTPIKIALHCNGWNVRSASPSLKSPLFSYALLRALGKSDEEAVQLLRQSQWRQIQEDVETKLPESSIIDSLIHSL